MTGTNHRETVLEILRDIAGSRRKIDDSTRIWHDLSVAGDDAVELLERIHKSCGTSFEGFEFARYFPNETDAILEGIVRRFGWDTYRALTVRHLLDAVDAGKWFDERQQPG